MRSSNNILTYLNKRWRKPNGKPRHWQHWTHKTQDEWTTQRHWRQHWTHKTQDEDKQNKNTTLKR